MKQQRTKCITKLIYDGQGNSWPAVFPESPIPDNAIDIKQDDEFYNYKIPYSDITKRQLGLALYIIKQKLPGTDNIITLEIIEEFIKNIQDDRIRSIADIEWKYSNTVSRYNKTFIQLASYMGIGEDELDNVFRIAEKIK